MADQGEGEDNCTSQRGEAQKLLSYFLIAKFLKYPNQKALIFKCQGFFWGTFDLILWCEAIAAAATAILAAMRPLH